MSTPTPGSNAWLALAHEAAIDPERPIIDPHHHLWHAVGGRSRYLLGDLWADTGSGHNIVKTAQGQHHVDLRADAFDQTADLVQIRRHVEHAVHRPKDIHAGPGPLDRKSVV